MVKIYTRQNRGVKVDGIEVPILRFWMQADSMAAATELIAMHNHPEGHFFIIPESTK